MNEELIKALDQLIEKYSTATRLQADGMVGCPLCHLFTLKNSNNTNRKDDSCMGCPNMYFAMYNTSIVGYCYRRGDIYPSLAYDKFENYPTLAQFWTDYKEMYLKGHGNTFIMEILLERFENHGK